MNSIHNNGKSDTSLNEGLDKLGQAYGQLGQDEPPELLDQAILNSAHRAVEKKARWMKFSWLHGLTTTAVFVLAFSLFLDQRESVPVFENGMRNAEPVSLQSAKPAKKQSRDVKDELRREMKSKADKREDIYKSMPVVPTLESEAITGESRNRAINPKAAVYAQDSLRVESESIDQDMEVSGLMLEEALLDKASSMTDAPELDLASREVTPAPATVAAAMAGPAEADGRAREHSQTEAEQQLLAIIKLKQSGDPGWEAALESFTESYPDYPLPKELKVP